MNTTNTSSSIRQRATKEIALLTGFLFLGLVVMPVVVYQVGQSVFGAYGGFGYGDFFRSVSAKVRSGDHVALFLVFSPYLGWQVLRLMAFAWHLVGQEERAS